MDHTADALDQDPVPSRVSGDRRRGRRRLSRPLPLDRGKGGKGAKCEGPRRPAYGHVEKPLGGISSPAGTASGLHEAVTREGSRWLPANCRGGIPAVVTVPAVVAVAAGAWAVPQRAREFADDANVELKKVPLDLLALKDTLHGLPKRLSANASFKVTVQELPSPHTYELCAPKKK